MPELTEFLLARIAEDEAVANAVLALQDHGEDRWWVDGPAERSGKWWVYATGEKFNHRQTAEHIARHDPARVLADCEAKKGLITEFSDATLAIRLEMPNVSDLTKYTGTALMVAVKYLALSYADHEDYREEWKP